MDVSHAEPADTCRLVRQSLLVSVETEIDDVADTQRLDVRELLFGRLAGCRDPIIQSAPVVDRLRVSHQQSPTWLRFRFTGRVVGVFRAGLRRRRGPAPPRARW